MHSQTHLTQMICYRPVVGKGKVFVVLCGQMRPVWVIQWQKSEQTLRVHSGCQGAAFVLLFLYWEPPLLLMNEVWDNGKQVNKVSEGLDRTWLCVCVCVCVCVCFRVVRISNRCIGWTSNFVKTFEVYSFFLSNWMVVTVTSQRPLYLL